MIGDVDLRRDGTWWGTRGKMNKDGSQGVYIVAAVAQGSKGC